MAKKKAKSLQRDASGRFLPASTRSQNASTPKKGKGKKSNPSKAPTKKGKRKSNPDDLKTAINGIPDQIMDLMIVALAWAIPGGIAVLIGDQGRASLAQTFKSPEGGQLAISAGWALLLFGATTYFQPLKTYRKRVMLGAGLRLLFDALNWGLPKTAGLGGNIRAFMGLPNADFRMGGVGTNTATGVKVQLDPEKKYFHNDQGVMLVAGEVSLVNGAWVRNSDKAPLLKPDGTPWKSSDVAALVAIDLSGRGGLGAYYYMWPQIPQAPANMAGLSGASPAALAGDLGSYWKLGLGPQPAYNPANTVNGYVNNYVYNARTGQYELAAVQQTDSAAGIGAFYNARPMSQLSRQLPKAGPQDDASYRL